MDKSVLSPSYPAWITQDIIVGREKEIETLKRMFFETDHPEAVFAFGVKGTGKTTIVRYLMNQFSTSNNKKIIYINCREAYTKNRILEKIAYELAVGKFYVLFKEKYRSKNYIEFIKEWVYETGTTLLIILDEIEKTFFVPGEERKDLTIYTLATLGEFLERGKIRCLFITNRAGLLEQCEDETRSRLCGSYMTFDLYSITDLYNILKKRVEYASAVEYFDDNLDDVILKIAKTVYNNFASDAREAINILRKSVEIAEQKRVKVDENIVNEAMRWVMIEGIARDIKSIGTDAVIILKTIFELKKNSPKNLLYWQGVTFSDIFKKYSEISLNVKTQRMIRFILEKMIQSSLISQNVVYKGKIKQYVYNIIEPELVQEALNLLEGEYNV